MLLLFDDLAGVSPLNVAFRCEQYASGDYELSRDHVLYQFHLHAATKGADIWLPRSVYPTVCHWHNGEFTLNGEPVAHPSTWCGGELPLTDEELVVMCSPVTFEQLTAAKMARVD